MAGLANFKRNDPETEQANDLSQLHQLHERRQNLTGQNSCYERLSLAQKISANHLQQYGFELQFIRGKSLEAVAVFTCDELSVAVDCYGEVDSLSALYFRKE